MRLPQGEKLFPCIDKNILLNYNILVMNYIATITSKRQLTIPAAIYAALNLKDGEKVLVSTEKNAIKISPALQLVNSLAGSVAIPKTFQNLTLEQIVKKAKKEYFGKKK